MKKNKILLISPQFGLGKGGIQTWAFYIDKLFRDNSLAIHSYGLREMKLVEFWQVFKASFTCSRFVLMTWKMMIAVVPVLFLPKREISIFIHGDEFLKLNKFQFILLKKIINNSRAKLIANSKAIANLFQKEFAKEVDMIQYPFVDIEEQCSLNIKKGKENIFFTITRLVKRKNIENVILSLKQLKEEGEIFKYYIAGDGAEKENLEKLVLEIGLSEEVIFLGRVTEEEKEKYLKKATLFFLPSVIDEDKGSIEGFGIVYIEANAYGVPVISGNTGGVVEAVLDKKTGLMTDGSVESITLAINRAIKHTWDYGFIVDYAKKFDYRNQKKLINFIADE